MTEEQRQTLMQAAMVLRTLYWQEGFDERLVYRCGDLSNKLVSLTQAIERYLLSQTALPPKPPQE